MLASICNFAQSPTPDAVRKVLWKGYLRDDMLCKAVCTGWKVGDALECAHQVSVSGLALGAVGWIASV